MAKRIQDLKSPTTRLRERVTDPLMRPFRKLTEDQRFWLGFILLSLITTLLINNPLWHIPSGQRYKPGDVARETVVSPADIYFTDNDESQRLQSEARESVKPIFRFGIWRRRMTRRVRIVVLRAKPRAATGRSSR